MKRILASIGVAAMIAILICSGTASAYEVASSVDGGIAYSNQHKLVRDSNGYWYAVFQNNSNVSIVKSTNTEGSSWGTPIPITGPNGVVNSSSTGSNPSIAINDARDTIHIVWVGTNSSTWDIHYSKCTDLANISESSAWKNASGAQGDDIIDNKTATSYAADIAVDSSGTPHVVWYGFENGSSVLDICYNYGDWSHKTVVWTDTNYYQRYPSIAINSSDCVFLAWRNYTTPYYTIDCLYTSDYTNFHRVSDPSNSHPETVISDNNNMSRPNIDIDSNDNVYIVAAEDTDNDLWMARWNGTAWSESIVDSTGWQHPALGFQSGSSTNLFLFAYSSASSEDEISYWKWNSTTESWSDKTDTGNNTFDAVVPERLSPASSNNIGYLRYNATTDTLYLEVVTFSGTTYDSSNPFSTIVLWSIPSDTTFTVTLAGGETEVVFTATSTTQNLIEPNSQDASSNQPIITITNDGNVNLNFTINLTSAKPSWAVIKVSNQSDHTTATEFDTERVVINSSVPPSGSTPMYLWTNITSATSDETRTFKIWGEEA